MPLLHGINSEIRSTGEEGEVISMSQFRALMYLQHKTGTLNDLARWHELSPATLSRVVNTLVERGWVTRQRDVADRRQVILEITEEGKAAVHDIGMRAQNHLAEALTELSPEELETVDSALSALSRIVAARRDAIQKP